MKSDPIVKNAVECGRCGAPADRYASYLQCQVNPAHIGDFYTGIFSDCSLPDRQQWKMDWNEGNE